MFSNFDARKSWQKATKFREHLSFISTQQQSSQQPPNTKSAWSPITPSESGHGHFTLMSSSEAVPPVPPIPAIHAAHVAPVERDPDEQRSIERARAEAAAALERGSRERQLERERLDRERQQRLLEKERQQQEAAATSFFDVESRRGPVPSLAPSSFTSKSKAALGRLSRAIFRFTSTPAAEPSSPFPQDSVAASSYIPRRLSDLSPWPPLNVSEKERQAAEAAAAVHHHHYYGAGSGDQSRSHSRAGSQDDYTMAEDHVHRDLGDAEKGKAKRCSTCYTEAKKRQRKSTIWCILLFLLILALIGNVVFLDIRVLTNTKSADVETPSAAASNSTFNPSSSAGNAVVRPTTTVPSGVTVTRSGTVTATSSASASSGVPAAVSSCLSQFTSSAASPASYPCGQCVPILSAIPNDLSSSSTSITGQGNILQFCALQAINAGLPSTSSSALTSVGWLKDTKPCTWQGVSCDGQGRISQLELVAPGVPTEIPDQVQFLVGLTSLKITGDNTVPSGSLSPLLAISSLQSLDLEQTGLQASMNDQTTFASLSALTSLTLVKNTGITVQGNSVAGITGMNLKSLILNFQSIPDNTLTLLAASTSNPISSSLSTLSLSNSNQAGSIPAALATTLPNLVELHLDGNAYSTLPANGGVIFPSKTTVVVLTGNSGMTGTISSAECQALQSASSSATCDFSGTGITLQTGVASCGNCKFGSTTQ
ncbi:hypothetical protein FRC04_003677 [Tulasnella sp. 424]|nr:hypothetical protein FRC04_003677 [Tulasnella sp. 424]KAG8977010.1 hypothetical protein FRC05_002529 [Tulasnella sp. 425]